MMNRIGNCKNGYQGPEKRVLCVCSAGLLRSPTAAYVLANEYGYNTRSVGVAEEYALFPLEEVHLHWADEVVCMEQWHADAVVGMMSRWGVEKPVVVLGVPDSHRRMDPLLCQMIRDAYKLQAMLPSATVVMDEEKKEGESDGFGV